MSRFHVLQTPRHASRGAVRGPQQIAEIFPEKCGKTVSAEPCGWKARPVEPDQQLEASLAWCWSNPHCEALEVSEQTFHRWRNQYGGMKSEEDRKTGTAPAARQTARPVFLHAPVSSTHAYSESRTDAGTGTACALRTRPLRQEAWERRMRCNLQF